jgi:DNA-binding NtrC family response regulator
MEVLKEIWLNHRGTATIMITGVNDVDTAVEATQYGATDYIVKPFDLDRVDTSIRTALLAKQAAISQESIAAIATR